MAVLPAQRAFQVFPSFPGPRFVSPLTFVDDPMSSKGECRVECVMMMFSRTNEEWGSFIPGLYGQSTGQE